MKSNIDLSRPITPQELAAFYSVSINTVYFWASRSSFPKIKVGRHLRFDLDKVRRHFDDLSGADGFTCQKPSFSVRPGRSIRSLKTRVNASRADPSK
jgi:hypothetical protein